MTTTVDPSARYKRKDGKPIPSQLTFDDTAYYVKRNGSIFLLLVGTTIFALYKLISHFTS